METVLEYLARIGAKGGEAKTPAKKRAAKQNAIKGWVKRRKLLAAK